MAKKQTVKLPDGFESAVRVSVSTGMVSTQDGEFIQQMDAVDSVMRRARRLSERGKLVGAQQADIENAIYGSAILWLFLWRYRSLIWFAIRTIAELAWQNRERDVE